jgi:hypothetical protein
VEAAGAVDERAADAAERTARARQQGRFGVTGCVSAVRRALDQQFQDADERLGTAGFPQTRVGPAIIRARHGRRLEARDDDNRDVGAGAPHLTRERGRVAFGNT